MASPKVEYDVNYESKDASSLESSSPPTDNYERAFQTNGLENYYKPIENYEGAHRYDPDFKWTASEERNVLRKVSEHGVVISEILTGH